MGSGDLVVSAAKNISVAELSAETAKHVFIKGDLSKLTDAQQLEYVSVLCQGLDLNPLTRPFEFTNFDGKTILYARKDCADQLRAIHRVSVSILSTKTISDVYIVHVKARTATGKEDEATGAVDIKGLSGKNLANAFMKAETKAKRRVTLSICGLGFLDETEVEDMQSSTNAADEVKKAIEIEKVVSEAIGPLSDFNIRIGKLAQYETLGNVPIPELMQYVCDIEESMARTKKVPLGAQKELYEAAKAYLAQVVESQMQEIEKEMENNPNVDQRAKDWFFKVRQ